MLQDFAHPMCHACCNYEGIDHIAEVIDKAKHMQQAFDTSSKVKRSHVQPTDVAENLPVAVKTASRPIVKPAGPTYAIIPQPQQVHQVSMAGDKGIPFLGPQAAFARMQPLNCPFKSEGLIVVLACTF